MTFLYRSSPLEGGKTISPADSKMRYTFDVLDISNVFYVKGIGYLPRHIRSDSKLLPADREALMSYAQSLCAENSGEDLEDVL